MDDDSEEEEEESLDSSMSDESYELETELESVRTNPYF